MTVILDAQAASNDELMGFVTHFWARTTSRFVPPVERKFQWWLKRALASPNAAMAYCYKPMEESPLSVALMVPHTAIPSLRFAEQTIGTVIVFLCGENGDCGQRAIRETLAKFFELALRRKRRRICALIPESDPWRGEILLAEGFTFVSQIFLSDSSEALSLYSRQLDRPRGRRSSRERYD